MHSIFPHSFLAQEMKTNKNPEKGLPNMRIKNLKHFFYYWFLFSYVVS